MNASRVLWSLITLFIPVIFASCGGGVNNSDYAGGGIGGTGISVGKITGFGSVWVNGIEYDTAGAIISIEGIESTSDGSLEYDSSLLDEGKIVTVFWTKDKNGNTIAERVEFDDNLEGPVATLNTINRAIEVLGQTVKVDGSTIFKDSINDLKTAGNVDAILEAIMSGNMIEVSGFVDVDGTIHATYVELKSSEFIPDVTEVEIKGVISNLDKDNKTFKLGNLTIYYTGTNFEDMTEDSLRNDLHVEVKGTLDINGQVLNATKIEVEDDIFEEIKGKQIEIEGVVTSPVDVNGQFEISGRSVKITDTTIFEDNTTKEDIILGLEIEVEGTVDENGVIVADKLSIESEDEIEDFSEDDFSDEDSLSDAEDISDDTVDSEEEDESDDLSEETSDDTSDDTVDSEEDESDDLSEDTSDDTSDSGEGESDD